MQICTEVQKYLKNPVIKPKNVLYIMYRSVQNVQKRKGGIDVMNMKPILFSTPMVQAILDGRKTMTRRICKPLTLNYPVRAYPNETPEQWLARWNHKPPYQPGDILWVRETWRDRWGMAYANYGTGNAYPIDDVREIEYKAGGNGFFMHGCNLCPDEPTVKWGEWSKWRPSIFMPREAARIFLRVTEVRVERLQDISYDDCLQEGMHDYGTDVDTLGAFQDLWQKLNAKRGYGWDKNPWVWVIGFERIERHGE